MFKQMIIIIYSFYNNNCKLPRNMNQKLSGKNKKSLINFRVPAQNNYMVGEGAVGGGQGAAPLVPFMH